ncbi:MAG: sigma factor-like helix-turn-helix DNA-binding protein [Pseudonocardiaceae bacterium]
MRQHDTWSHPMKDRMAPANGNPHNAELVDDLLSLRQQLAVVTASPAVATAHQLLAEVSLVLEPVWSVLAAPDESTGVGFLRRLGHTTAEVEALNTAVVCQAAQTYQTLNLVAPTMRDVWRSLARPAAALVASVRSRPRQQSPKPDDQPTVGTLGATVRPMLPVELFGAWNDDTEVVPAVRRVLRRWCDLARNATGEQCEVARLTLAAALLARGAILDGDTATVKWFIAQWLGLRATDSRVDGASAALLEGGWVHRSVDDEFSAVRDTVTDLRIEAAYQHRLHRPVWETQLRGAPIGLLSEQPGSLDSNGVALADILAAGDDPVAAAAQTLLENQLQAVLATISEREARVIRGRFTGKTQKQLAVELRTSTRTIRRIESITLSKLRHPSRSQVLRDYLD